MFLMKEVVILSAVRTPIGKFGKSLSSLSAIELGTLAAKNAIDRSKIPSGDIDQAIIGNVLQTGLGQNPARQIAINSGLSTKSTAMTINQVCGSGMKAIRLGQSAIIMGDATTVLVGGTESMSNVPYIASQQLISKNNVYEPHKDLNILENDGLLDAFSNNPMGVTAENVAEKYHVTRNQQDAFALRSHQKAVEANLTHVFDDEIVPIFIKGKHPAKITSDEAIRQDTSITALNNLKTIFKDNGTVTAGNSAGLNDGASMLILMEKEAAISADLPYLATIDGYQEIGINPNIMGYAPYYAVSQLMKKQQRIINDYDRIELNEAFASQSVAVSRDLHIADNRLNVNGGAIAIGHPLGASGARIITSLVHQLHHDHLENGLATLCVGGGMGVAMSVKKSD